MNAFRQGRIVLLVLGPLSFAHAGASDHYDLSNLKVLSKVVVHIKDEYAEPMRLKPQELFVRALEGARRAEPRIHVHTTSTDARVAIAVAEETFAIGAVDTLWKMRFALNDTAKFVADRLPRDAGDSERRGIEISMINEMLTALDNQSRLLRPEEARKLLRLKGSDVVVDREHCLKLFDLADGLVLRLRVKREACPNN